jgi:hypothetical protein
MGAINSITSNIVLPVELFVKSQKEAKRIIKLASCDTANEHIKKLNKKMYQRKVQGY